MIIVVRWVLLRRIASCDHFLAEESDLAAPSAAAVQSPRGYILANVRSQVFDYNSLVSRVVFSFFLAPGLIQSFQSFLSENTLLWRLLSRVAVGNTPGKSAPSFHARRRLKSVDTLPVIPRH